MGGVGRALGMVLALLIVWERPITAAATPDGPQFEIGFNGIYKVGRWTPVRVTGLPADSRATLAAGDPDGRTVEFPLTAQPDGSFTGLFLSGRLDAPIRVTVTNDEQSRVHLLQTGANESLRSFRQETRFWLVTGDHPGFTAAAGQLNAEQRQSIPAVELIRLTTEQIPDRAEALAGIDVVVLGSETVPQSQSEALRNWVAQGGRLIVLAGSDGERLSQQPLGKWLPVSLSATIVERQTSVLTSRITAFVPDNPPLRTLENISIAPLTLRDGVTLIESPEGVVVSSSAYGLGMVTVVTLDLDRPPFADPRTSTGAEGRGDATAGVLWSGLPAFCRKLAGETTVEVPSVASESQLAPTGISDMQTQLAMILDHFPQVSRPSNWNVIGLIIAYLLLIGPVDYLIVHRLLRKPQLTWVTLPAWILLGAWWSTSYAAESNGRETLVNQLHLVDIAADTGTQRTLGWFSLYSPETRRHTITAEPQSFSISSTSGEQPGTSEARGNENLRVSWLPRPEETFRGMYRRGGIDLGAAGYRLGVKPGEAEQVPVAIWSSQALVAETQNTTPPHSDTPPIAECRQEFDSFGRMVKFELTHHLPGELEDWFVVEGVQAKFPLAASHLPMSLPPDQPRDLLQNIGQQLLRTYVQGESATAHKTKHGEQLYVRAETYDPLGLDVDRFFRTLSFREAIGGLAYTRLTNQTLNRLDYSEMIHRKRLVVFGRLNLSATKFSVDGQPVPEREPATWVRLIVPIHRETSGTPVP